MKKHALSWLADRLMPKPIITLDPVVHQIGYNAVAEALTTSETLEPASGVTHLQPSTGPEVVKGVVIAAQPGTPEYHLGLMNQMITTLTTRIERAETKRADQRKAYEQDRHDRAAKQVQSDQEQAAEIAGLVKSLAAYKAAHEVLSVPPTVPDPVAVAPVGAKPARRRPAKTRPVGQLTSEQSSDATS